MQHGLTKHPDIPDVPLSLDYAKTDEQREILRILMGMRAYSFPFFIAPDVPKERADALQAAFDKAMTDADFLEDAAKQNRGIGMATGAEVQAAIARAYALPATTLEKARAAVAAN
mgnify:CR=1 FL=1